MIDCGPLPALSDQERATWDTFLLACANVQNQRDRVLRKYGLSISEYDILFHLYDSKNRRARMSGLAESVYQSRSRTTHAAQRLENQGYLTRQLCVDDRRGVSAVLTEKGVQLMDEAVPEHEAAIKTAMVGRLSSSELNVVQSALRRIAHLS